MPYWCTDCRSYFSIKTGTLLEYTQLPLRRVYAIYLHVTSLKSISSMKLHRSIGVSQKTAWHMLQRIRKTFDDSDDDGLFDGPVEFDETYVGGKRKNISNSERKALADTGRGTAGKTAVVGAKDRETNQVHAQIVAAIDKPTLHGLVFKHAAAGTTVYTDEASVYQYQGLPTLFYDHESVRHSVSEYVNGMAHTNGLESFWSMLKRGYVSIYHKMNPNT